MKCYEIKIMTLSMVRRPSAIEKVTEHYAGKWSCFPWLGDGSNIRNVYSYRVYKLRRSKQNTRKTTVVAFEHVGKFVANIETIGYDPSWAAF